MGEVLGDAALELGLADEAEQALSMAADIRGDRPDPLLKARLLRKRARAALSGQQPAKALDLLEAARRELVLSPTHREEWVRLQCAIAEVLVRSGQPGRAVGESQLALETAEADGSVPAQAEASRWLGSALARCHRCQAPTVPVIYPVLSLHCQFEKSACCVYASRRSLPRVVALVGCASPCGKPAGLRCLLVVW